MIEKFVLAANWKMHKNPIEAKEFFSEFIESTGYANSKVKTLFFPPSIDLMIAKECLSGKAVGWGAQNIYFTEKGAVTGEISAKMTADIGATHVLVGHSERRTLFNETNEECAKKIIIAQQNNLVPILCVGETLEQRQLDKTNDVLKLQIQRGLEKSLPEKSFIVAYEPVWAIGTGEVATAQQVQDAHEYIRSLIKQLCGERGSQIPILYGGSVKPGNASDLAQIEQVGGFLVGSASLEVESFNKIIEASLS